MLDLIREERDYIFKGIAEFSQYVLVGVKNICIRLDFEGVRLRIEGQIKESLLIQEYFLGYRILYFGKDFRRWYKNFIEIMEKVIVYIE